MAEHTTSAPQGTPWTLWFDAASYAIDAWQRSVLYFDVLRQRGNQYHEHMAEAAPNVLSFRCELVLSGATLPRPVNYGLVRIVPPRGVSIDPKKRPFVVVDPRAGHGPGHRRVQGRQRDRHGHARRACLLLRGLPAQSGPGPDGRGRDAGRGRVPRAGDRAAPGGGGQAGRDRQLPGRLADDDDGSDAARDVRPDHHRRRAALLLGRRAWRESDALHGRAAWAGAGSRRSPGDMGHGIFDGAWLVKNFESMNPANTLWGKQYNLYANIDTEAPRYLGFERWWGGHVLLNAEEMQYIVDNLFVGNKLATAELVTRDGVRIDLREIRSPIIVFCSKGDDITPPQQALGWITDLYASVEDIRAHGQTIVYCVHESVGHLGIFVSGSVAKKEHEEFASNIDFIDVLPPGLYEAVITAREESDANPDLVVGDYVLRFAARDLDDIRALGGNEPEDERRFATVARLSEINLGLYRTMMQPFVKADGGRAHGRVAAPHAPVAAPVRAALGSQPVHARPLEGLAQEVRRQRQPAAADNPLLQAEHVASEQIEKALDGYRELREQAQERLFLAAYGSPLLQALVGLRATDEVPRRRPGNEPEHRAFVARQAAQLRSQIAEGGLREAALRALIYVGLAERVTDERTFNMLRRIREERGGNAGLAAFKQALRDQFLMLLLDPQAALAALPKLLQNASAAEIRPMLEDVKRVVTAGGSLSAHAQGRLQTIETIFEQAASRADAGASPAEAVGEAAKVAAVAPDTRRLAAVSEPTPLPRRVG